ncbi:MAG: ParB/Srx family N-terminal domain-containing protein [Azonexaceae bacterium]|nr:ParB/Srx family N-terminal domain-containing protein [Azonexaceae bacterium]
MSRNLYYNVTDLSIEDLLLDTHNPRIRHGADQADCIARLMRDKDALQKLIRDIASKGLTPEHILVSKAVDGKWRVRDGNRRIASLKLLNRPSLAQADAQFANQVAQIAAEHQANIPSVVNCLACDDEATILDYIERKHTGENAGIGQKSWEAMLISLFKLEKHETDQHRRAAQLLLWGETQNLAIDDNFPITTLTRGLNTETLALIGFKVDNDELVPTLPIPQAYALASRVINDIATGRINVARDGGAGSIYSSEQRDGYFKQVRQEIGPALPTNPPPAASSGGAGDGSTQAGNGAPPSPANANVTPGNSAGNNIDSADQPRGGGNGSQPRSPSPTTHPSNRNNLFGPRKNSSPGITIPQSETKVQTIFSELRKLNPKDTPLAVAMLMRSLIELSNNYYRERHSLRKNDLHLSVANSADHMKTSGLLTAEQHETIMRYTRGHQGILHIKTLHHYVHRTDAHPDAQSLNTTWDELRSFVVACWH